MEKHGEDRGKNNLYIIIQPQIHRLKIVLFG